MTHPAGTLLQDLVRFPSLSRQEAAIADFVQGFAAGHGLQTGRLEDNVYFWIGEGSPTLLLNSHLDVVPPSNDHPYEPFTPTVVDGYLYGRGAVDAKASGAAMIAALVGLKESGWTPAEGRVMVALTACEELGGGYNGLEALRPHLGPVHAAIVGEPTSLKPCVAQKGLLILKMTAHGRTAHAARAHLGENAVQKAARDIVRLADYHFEREDPFLGRPTATVTTIEGGTARNVVPDTCTFYVDIRTTPAYTHEEIVTGLQATLESEVAVHSKRLVPVHTGMDERIVTACRAALPDAEPFGSPTASDWVFLSDVPTVKLGPGDSEESHTAGEHILLSEVERAAEVYQNIIRTYFSS